MVATGWPRGDAVAATTVATGDWSRLTHRAGSVCLSAKRVALVWHGWHLANKAPPAKTLILYGFEARVAGVALVFHLLGENKK